MLLQANIRCSGILHKSTAAAAPVLQEQAPIKAGTLGWKAGNLPLPLFRKVYLQPCRAEDQEVRLIGLTTGVLPEPWRINYIDCGM